MEFLLPLIAITVVGMAFLITSNSNRRQKRLEARQHRNITKKNTLNSLSSNLGFLPSYNIIEKYDGLYASSKDRKIVIFALTFDMGLKSKTVINFEDVQHCHFQNGETLVTSSVTENRNEKKGQLTRAAIGGVAFGPAGAIVGALTAKDVSKTKTTNLVKREPNVLKILCKSTELPVIEFKSKSDELHHVYMMIEADLKR